MATGAQITILPDITFGKIYRVTRELQQRPRHDAEMPTTPFSGLLEDRGPPHDQSRPAVRSGIARWRTDQGLAAQEQRAPRIGAAHDLTGNGRTKVYGNYGIYYNRVPNDLAARALSADVVYSRADYFDAGLTRPIPAGVSTKTPTAAATTTHSILLGAFPDDVDPNAKMSYNNEIVLGFEREIMARTTFGVRYVFPQHGSRAGRHHGLPMAAYARGNAIGSVRCHATSSRIRPRRRPSMPRRSPCSPLWAP